MKKKIKILFTNLSYLNHNYGTQAITFSLMDKLNKHFDAEYTIILHEKYYKDNILFSKKYNFNIVTCPSFPIMLGWHHFFINIPYNLIYLLKNKTIITKDEKRRYSVLVEELKKSDVAIDLSGIEFIGNRRFKNKWWDYMNIIYMQCLSKKYNKPYFKFTKSYGPFPDKIYRFFVKKSLNNLPFIFVRGKDNLKFVRELNIKTPIYSFPDISIGLAPESKNWAIDYITNNVGLDFSKPIVGFSPSFVINEIAPNYIRLCKETIKFFQLKDRQVLLIPHSLGDGKDSESCDLALSKKIYSELENQKGTFIISDMTLTYKQVRAIIGLLSFYITGRYHSISSALSMGVPAVSFSWHTKYKDIMSLFLDDFLVIDRGTTSVKESLLLIKKYYNNRQWFNREEVLKRKEEAIREIDKSINILVKEIKKYI